MLSLSGKSCGGPEFGSKSDDGRNPWSDRDVALMKGPITAIRVWHTTCGIIAYVDETKDMILCTLFCNAQHLYLNSLWNFAASWNCCVMYNRGCFWGRGVVGWLGEMILHHTWISVQTIFLYSKFNNWPKYPLNNPSLKFHGSNQPSNTLIIQSINQSACQQAETVIDNYWILTINNSEFSILRVQCRYGNVWAPRHPSSSGGTAYSVKLDAGESWETLEVTSGWVIGAPWWRHQMETFSALLAIWAGNSPVSGEFPAQRPVTRSFDIFFDLRLNKRLSKQSWGWWFETLSCPLWCQCNASSQHHEKIFWAAWGGQATNKTSSPEGCGIFYWGTG